MKKFKKITEIIVICIFVLMWASVNCCAESDGVSDLIGQDTQAEIFSLLPEETVQLFDELGIDEIDYQSIFSPTPQSVFNAVKKLLTGQFEAPTKSLVRLLSVIILLAICECFVPDGDKVKLAVEMAGVTLCVLCVASPVSMAISSAVSSIAVCEKLMLVLIPVLAAVITVAGNPVLAVSFQSIGFYMAQIISGVSQKFIVPVVGAVLSVDVAGSLVPDFKINGITSLVKKTLTVVLSFVSTMFVSFLGLKGVLSNAADTVANKGIKMIISSAVPVVGGALSEAYTGIVGTLVLARSTVGVFGIAAIALITLPSCVQLVFWIFSLRLAGAVGDLFNQSALSELLRNVASAITLLNVVLLFNGVLFIISTALVLVIKAG